MGVTGPRRLGAFEVWLVDSGRFRLDGGAMFGVVPRALWEKRIEPDHRNRVWLSLNCLLVRTPDETVLIEAGIGDKLPRKKQEIYSVEPGSGLLGSLSEAGVAPEDVDHVVLTHLHMDHAGGATVAKGGGVRTDVPPGALRRSGEGVERRGECGRPDGRGVFRRRRPAAA